MLRLASILAVLAAPVFAHEWYDLACCSDEDCARVPVSSVSATADGWLITLEAGDHRLVTGQYISTLPYDAALRSQDGDFHVCIHKMTGDLLCVYTPDMSG